MSRKWTNAEINYLKRYAASKSLEELAQRFDSDEAAIRAKLGELSLASKDGPVTAGDTLLATFEEALRALHASQWQQAGDLFARVIGDSDLPEVAARARQYLAICRAQLGEGAEADEPADPFARAVYHKNRGEYALALDLCRGKPQADDERFLYLAASVHALERREEEAVRTLRRAVEQNPENRVHAFHDPDFAELRQRQEHGHLFGLG